MASLLAASLLWALSFGLIKGELAGLSPLAVAAGRLVIAALLFLPLALRRLPGGRARVEAAALGALQFGLMYILYIAAFRWLAAWVVALLTVLTPLYVLLLAGRAGTRGVVAVAVAIAGAALVSWRDAPGAAGWPGVLLLQGSNLCFAAGQLRYGRLRERWQASDAGLVGWMYLGAAGFAVALLPLAAFVGPAPFGGWTPRALLVLLYLGAIPTALGFHLWNRGAARTAAPLLAAANNLKVPLAVLASWFVFGEDVAGGRALLGALLLAVALLVAGDRRRGRPATP